MKFEEKSCLCLFFFVVAREGIKRLIDICFGGVEDVECRWYCLRREINEDESVGGEEG